MIEGAFFPNEEVKDRYNPSSQKLEPTDPYIDCNNCNSSFDPRRETELNANPMRCGKCGHLHSKKDIEWNSYVYLMQAKDMFKIGISKNPKQRARELQTGNPYEISVCVASLTPDASEKEDMLHEKFDQQRFRNEWFDLDDVEAKQAKRMLMRAALGKTEKSDGYVFGEWV